MAWINRLFSSSDSCPTGFCYTWDLYVIWLNGGSDILIALAYYTIPFALVYFVARRRDLAFHWMFLCLALFIIACGTTHFIEFWTNWRPMYWLAGVIKALTAAASITTAIALISLVPQALALPSPEALKKANLALQEAQVAIRQTNEELEGRVEQLRVLSCRLFQIQEDERRHLARELHDQMGQALTAAKITLQAAQRLEEHTAIVRRLDDSIAILEWLLQQTRQLCWIFGRRF
jgi:signal transduction histidine kinase